VTTRYSIPTKDMKRGIRRLLNFLSPMMIGKGNWATILLSILCQECEGGLGDHFIFYFVSKMRRRIEQPLYFVSCVKIAKKNRVVTRFLHLV